MKKVKYKAIKKKIIIEWITIANLLAKSMCPYTRVITEFNGLDSKKRIEIKKMMDEYDEIRRTKIPEDMKDSWEIGVMVDANIIACEFDIDPLTVVACIKPPCHPNEKIFISA